MKYFYVNHVTDVWATARHKGVDVGIAYEMYRADIRLGAAHEENSDMKDIDFAALNATYSSMTDDEQQNETHKIYHAFIRECYDIICKYFDMNINGINEVINDFKTDYEAKLAAEAAELIYEDK